MRIAASPAFYLQPQFLARNKRRADHDTLRTTPIKATIANSAVVCASASAIGLPSLGDIAIEPCRGCDHCIPKRFMPTANCDSRSRTGAVALQQFSVLCVLRVLERAKRAGGKILRLSGRTQARPIYAPVRVSILTVSPSLMKSGTLIVLPLSSFAGLVTLLAVSPRRDRKS